MACYHPLAGIAYYNEYTDKGAIKYHIYGSYHPELKKNLSFKDVIKVPCGHCIGCALDSARKWSDRMILEFLSSGNRGIFVTLTYNNDHVPIACDEDGVFREFTLCKDDVQKFFKRLRKHFSGREIKFYLAGEYGPKTFRPHYHAIIFGVSLDDFPDRLIKGKNELGQEYYVSNEFQSIWSDRDNRPIGFHCLSDVSYKTCNYVARYCMKKIGKGVILEYAEPEFHLMSRRPGLGYTYLAQHPDFYESDIISVSDSTEQKDIRIPRYFYDRLKIDNPDIYDILDLKSSRELMNDKELIKLQNTSLSYLDMLEIEENNKINKTKILFKRGEM